MEWNTQYIVPRKQTKPVSVPNKKEVLAFFPHRAMRSGTRAIHANMKKSKGGNAKTSISPEIMDSIISVFLDIRYNTLNRYYRKVISWLLIAAKNPAQIVLSQIGYVDN